MKTRVWIIATTLAVTLATQLATAEPAGTGFTYQGQLKLNGRPIDGTTDLCFTLHAANTGGTPIGTPICFDGQTGNPPPVAVENGQFTVILDFGASAIDGQKRWLEVKVRHPAGVGDYQDLTPFQKITPTPYALQTRGLHVAEDGSLDVAGQIRMDNEWQAMVLSGDPAQSQWSEIVWEALGAADPNRFGIGVDQTGLFFSRRNSDNTSVGTTMFLKQDGKVGIGTMNPAADLEINSGAPAIYVEATIGTNYAFQEYQNTGGNLRIGIDNSIGTGLLSGSSPYAGIISKSGAYPLYFATNNVPRMIVDSVGNVGIGTTTPGDRLTLAGNENISTSSAHMGSLSGSGGAVFGYNAKADTTSNVNDQVVVSHTDETGYSFIRMSNTSGGMQFHSTAGTVTAGDVASSEVMRVTSGGKVGIGTNSPSARLDVLGGATVEGQIHVAARFRVSDAPAADSGVLIGSVTGNTPFIGTASGGGTSSGLTFRTENQERLRITNSGDVGIGTASPGAKLDVRGTVKVEVIQITGADLAERFPMSEKLEPGTVVEIDPDHSGQLRASRDAYSPRVAGIVSGANGLSVGAVLGNLTGENDGPPIALAGRVYCWVDADAGGAVQPGDLLTTSSTPGHAMRVNETHNMRRGCVIGKAMTPLSQGKGLVLVLVQP